MKPGHILLILSALLLIAGCRNSNEVNYDESFVPSYKLPELFICEKGDSVSDYDDWNNTRRKEIISLFESEVYGNFPDLEYAIEFEERLLAEGYLEGLADIKEITSVVSTSLDTLSFKILFVYPSGQINIPVFVGLNFGGNHTLDTLSSITLPVVWDPDKENGKVSDHRASEHTRGSASSRWPLSTIISRGYGVATVYYGEFDPDYDDGFKNGMHPLFADVENTERKEIPGSISIWAKGISMIADYLVGDSIADANSLIVIGHSRLGKTALWCGVNDERFSAVISNNSGCGGAALSMRAFGETIEAINTNFPHWFSERFKRYNGKEQRLPVDQHMLLALIAPRALYVASATEDQWADPTGEFLALKEAARVYELFGHTQNFPGNFPSPDRSYSGITGYHLRSGPHDITEFDWIMYLNWCNQWLVQ